MRFRISPNFLLFNLLVPLVIFLGFPRPLMADPIAMEHTLGFNGTFRLKDWTPVTVVLENRSQRFQGRLQVLVTSGSEYQNDVYQTTYSTDVDLPTHSKKTYTLTIFIDSYVHPLILRLQQNRNTIISKSINLRSHFVTKPLLVFAEENLKDLSQLNPEECEPVYSPFEFLPESWVGYHGVKGLILKGVTWKNLRPRQYQAIKDWIKAGGYVITTGSLNENSLSLESLDPLLSIRVEGLERVKDLPALQTFSGAKLTSPGSFLILKVVAPQAQPLLMEKDLTLILEKGIGRGKILFFTFDVTEAPFRNWTGRGTFWEKILDLAPKEEATSWNLKTEKIINELQLKMPARFPSFFLIFPFITGYILLAALLMKRIRGYPERTLKTLSYLILGVLGCSLTGFGMTFFAQTPNKISFNGIFHMKLAGSQGLGHWQYLLGVYSQKKGLFKLPLGSSPWMVSMVPTENPDAEKFHSYTLHESQEDRFLIFPLHRWSERFFILSGFRDFPIQAKAGFQDQDLVVAVDNQSPFSIRGCQIFFENRLYFLGQIGPKEKQVRRLKPKTSDPEQIFGEKAIESFLEDNLKHEPALLKKELEIELNKNLWISIHREHPGKESKIVLVGWIDSQVFASSQEPQAPFLGGAGLLEWEIPLEVTAGN